MPVTPDLRGMGRVLGGCRAWGRSGAWGACEPPHGAWLQSCQQLVGDAERGCAGVSWIRSPKCGKMHEAICTGLWVALIAAQVCAAVKALYGFFSGTSCACTGHTNIYRRACRHASFHALSVFWPIALAAATGHAGGVLAPGLGAVGGLWLFVRCGFAAAWCAVLFAALGDHAARSRHGGAGAGMLGMALSGGLHCQIRENWGVSIAR